MDDDKDRYWTSPIASKNTLSKPGSPTTTSPKQDNKRAAWILTNARRVFSAYRKDDFADPAGFLDQLLMVLERYDDATITWATSPITGIQRECKFPPSIAELVEFCDSRVRQSSYASDWDRRAAEQLRQRELYEAEVKTTTPEQRAAVVARIKGELRAAGFHFKGDVAPATPKAVMDKYGITQEQWDALPDAQPGSWDKLTDNFK
jgi:hypothetical protein